MSDRIPGDRLLLPACWSRVLVLACLGACDGEPINDHLGWSYPLDGTLTFADLQALGTHNSYHVEPEGNEVPEWDYTMSPLDVQLGVEGVRQFELDVYAADDELLVMHVPFLDQVSTCASLQDCLVPLRSWSERNQAHHPVFVLIELKTTYQESEGAATLTRLDETLEAGLGGLLITPDGVQGSSSSLQEAVEQQGWPTLGALRGRYLFVLHDSGEWRDAYTEGGTTTAGRSMFPDGGSELDLPVGVVHTMNDPVGQAALIAEAVALGHLVRTRADWDPERTRANDHSSADAALLSGAHFVSTDYPTPHADSGYFVKIPGGTPSRCNPLREAEGCTAEAIEDPAFISP